MIIIYIYNLLSNTYNGADISPSTQDNQQLEETDELVVYSSRNERFVDEFLQKFEQKQASE